MVIVGAALGGFRRLRRGAPICHEPHVEPPPAAAGCAPSELARRRRHPCSHEHRRLAARPDHDGPAEEQAGRRRPEAEGAIDEASAVARSRTRCCRPTRERSSVCGDAAREPSYAARVIAARTTSWRSAPSEGALAAHALAPPSGTGCRTTSSRRRTRASRLHAEQDPKWAHKLDKEQMFARFRSRGWRRARRRRARARRRRSSTFASRCSRSTSGPN